MLCIVKYVLVFKTSLFLHASVYERKHTGFNHILAANGYSANLSVTANNTLSNSVTLSFDLQSQAIFLRRIRLLRPRVFGLRLLSTLIARLSTVELQVIVFKDYRGSKNALYE